MEESSLTYAVLIGGSAGSLEILVRLLPTLPENAPYALAIILHRKSGEDTTLEELIRVKSSLPLVEVEDKTIMTAGRVYVAPSDYHLLFEKTGTLSLDISEKINYSRPSIDVSFESAADAYGSRLAAILLSGANADGTDGLRAIKRAGGITAVQDPATAEMPFMPQSALEAAAPDHVLDFEHMEKFLSTVFLS